MLLHVALVLSAMMAVASAADVRALGCYVDSAVRDLPISKQLGATAKKDTCLAFCKSQKTRFFGLQGSEWCFCGNTFHRYRQVRQKYCNLKCRGDAANTCGGKWRNQIFTTGIDDFTLPRLGCFRDRGNPRDLPNLHHLGAKNSRQACLNYCKSKKTKYFGLQAGTWCTCGNSYGKHGKVGDDRCNRPCPAEPGATCGGHWRNEVYATGL